MLKKSLLFLVLIFFSTILFSLPNNFYLNIKPFYSIGNGTLYEYVIVNDKNSNTDTKLSELEWDLSNISYLGLELSTSWKQLSVSLQFKGAIPKRSGNMIDLDWLDNKYENNKYYYNDLNKITTKSINEEYLEQNYFFDIYFFYEFNPIENFYISPSIGFSFDHINFHGKNGYGWYGNQVSPIVAWNDSTAIFYEKGRLYPINYERETINTYLGIQVRYEFFDKLNIFFKANISPYTSVQSLDYHYSNMSGTSGTYYYDIMDGWFKQFNLSLGSDYSIWKNILINCSFDINFLNRIYGITYKNSQKKFTIYDKQDSKSACSGNWWNFKFGCTYIF